MEVEKFRASLLALEKTFENRIPKYVRIFFGLNSSYSIKSPCFIFHPYSPNPLSSNFSNFTSQILYDLLLPFHNLSLNPQLPLLLSHSIFHLFPFQTHDIIFLTFLLISTSQVSIFLLSGMILCLKGVHHCLLMSLELLKFLVKRL